MPSDARKHLKYLVTNVTLSQHAAANTPGLALYPPNDLTTLSPRSDHGSRRVFFACFTSPPPLSQKKKAAPRERAGKHSAHVGED